MNKSVLCLFAAAFSAFFLMACNSASQADPNSSVPTPSQAISTILANQYCGKNEKQIPTMHLASFLNSQFITAEANG